MVVFEFRHAEEQAHSDFIRFYFILASNGETLARAAKKEFKSGGTTQTVVGGRFDYDSKSH